MQQSKATNEFSTTISKLLGQLIASLNPNNQESTLSVLRKIFGNILQHPSDDKYRQIKMTDHTFNTRVWQYPASKELMKISGWIVEVDHIYLRNDSSIKIVSQLLNVLCEHCHAGFVSLDTNVVPLPDDEFIILVNAIINADMHCIQKLLRVSHISPNNVIYSKSGLSINLLGISTIAQKIDIVKLLIDEYSVDLYSVFMDDDLSESYFEYIFSCAPQSFIIQILKYCSAKSNFKTEAGASLLHLAVYASCFDVVRFLVEECNGEVNVTDDGLLTPLHVAYLAGQTCIAQYLLQHGADENAMDKHDYVPYEYIEGHPGAIEFSHLIQNKRKIHQNPYSNKHCYYLNLIKLGTDDEEAITLTIEKFPSSEDDANHEYIVERPTDNSLVDI